MRGRTGGRRRSGSRRTRRPPGSPVSRCSIQRAPSMPWNTRLKQVEPIRMNTTITIAAWTSWLLSGPWRRCIAARTIAPTAPMAPASVGVANPRPMVPRTRKIRTIDGIMPHSTRLTSSSPSALARTPEWGAFFAAAGSRCRRCRAGRSPTCRMSGTDRAEIHITNRAAELVGEHDQHEGRRDRVIVPDAAITPVASRIS